MPASRILEAALSPKRSPPTQGRSQWLSRAGSALASPSSILIVVPLLVIVVGLTLTALADRALRDSNLQVAHERLHDQAQTVARMVRATLGQSDAMLERLADAALHHTSESPVEPFAHTLADLMKGRPGVTYVSVSFADGTFQGVYLDPDRVMRFQVSRVTGDGTAVQRFALGERGTLTMIGEEKTDYDPRQRDFYKLAIGARHAIWTEPYAFYSTHQTGITRALPVYARDAGAQRLHAVLTVDYDVSELSEFLDERRLPAMRAVLYAHDGTVLAYAGDTLADSLIRPRENRTLRFGDLVDPPLVSFAAMRAGATHGQLVRVMARDRPYLAVTANASVDTQLNWSIAYLAPEDLFLRGLYSHRRHSLWVAGGVLAVALIVSFLFARHVTRVRREIRVARAAAARAESHARELGSYRLTTCLGKGGMGEVWRAEHRLLAREAAIKLINPGALDGEGQSSEELNARFRREAEALASLRSRHTIELFDYGVAEDGTLFLVMELLDGLDLETLVNRHGAQPAERVLKLMIQSCASLAEAHDVGFIHRDIKPANIFVCRAADELDVVKVLDFGLVRTDEALAIERRRSPSGHNIPANAANLTLSGGALGTPGYMPPEQAYGHEIDGRADLFALGCVAYWLLTGKPLYAQEQPLQRLLATLTDPPDVRAGMPAHVPLRLVALIEACVASDRASRPRDARSLRQALMEIACTGEEHRWAEGDAHAFWAALTVQRTAVRAEAAANTENPARTLLVS